jgi:hypothetical protein
MHSPKKSCGEAVVFAEYTDPIILKPAVPFMFFQQRNELSQKILISFHKYFVSRNFVSSRCIVILFGASLSCMIRIAKCFTYSSKRFRYEVLFENEHTFCS